MSSSTPLCKCHILLAWSFKREANRLTQLLQRNHPDHWRSRRSGIQGESQKFVHSRGPPSEQSATATCSQRSGSFKPIHPLCHPHVSNSAQRTVLRMLTRVVIALPQVLSGPKSLPRLPRLSMHLQIAPNGLLRHSSAIS